MSRDVRAEFARATALHREGRLDAAVDIYRRILKAHPGALEIQSLLVFAQLQAGRPKEALNVARKAREAHPSNPHAHILLGAAQQAGQHHDRALAAFEAAAVLQPGLSEAHYLAGNALVALGRLVEAVARFDRALVLDPLGVEARTNRAAALSRLGREEEALGDLDRLVEMQPWDATHAVAKAGALLALHRYEAAAEIAEDAMRRAPDSAGAALARVQALLGLGRFSEVRATLDEALRRWPDDAALSNHLITLLRLTEDFPSALVETERALALNPHSATLLQHRGEIRRALGDAEGAFVDAEAAVAQEPGFAIGHLLRARLLADRGEPDEARAALDEAVACDPDQANALYLAACDDLSRGRWREGWARYEHRERSTPAPYTPLDFTRWDGEAQPETLIVLAEQGIGDQIQFGRLLRTLADRGIAARLLAKPRHASLLSLIDARVPVVTDLGDLDLSHPGVMWTPLASLPGLIAPDPADWPRPPYLTADPRRVGRWAPREDGVFRIGIAWQGNPSPNVDVGRSVPLEMFAPLAAIAGVELISLQKGAGTEQVARASFAHRIVDPAAELEGELDADGTFLDTSGLLHHLDLVVTTDTALAHLAGARGRPAFVALRKEPDWRWGRSGETSELYPSLRLFRQERAGDWAGVFERIVQQVKVIASEQGHDKGL